MGQKILGAGILAFDKSTGRVLLGRRGMKDDLSGRNTFAPFGGTWEKGKDKTPRITAIREFCEETGCKVPFQLSKKPFFINDDNHVRFYTYIGIFEKAFPVKINDESLDYCWFDIKSLPENLHPGVKEMFAQKYEDLKAFADYIKNKPLNENSHTNNIYIFHGTGKGQALNIQKNGFMKANNTGEEQLSISFAEDLNYALYYAKAKGGTSKMVILRTKLNNSFQLSPRIRNNKGDEYVTFKNIPVSALEIMTTSSGWQPLNAWNVIFDEPL